MQYEINREAAKISALTSGKIDKYEYRTVEEIIPADQRRVIELAKFAYSPSENTFEKQTKIIEEQGKKTSKSNWRTRKKTSWSFKGFKNIGK